MPLRWMDKVWLMCVAMKSSYLLFAPGTRPVGSLEGEFWRQRTASIYARRSGFVKETLV